jgi:hypothetical protein
MGFNTDQKPPAGAMVKGMIFMVIGNFLLAFVFAQNILVWDPRTWGQAATPGSTPAGTAILAAFFTWLGFFFPGDLNSVAWEMKSWKFFFYQYRVSSGKPAASGIYSHWHVVIAN